MTRRNGTNYFRFWARPSGERLLARAGAARCSALLRRLLPSAGGRRRAASASLADAGGRDRRRAGARRAADLDDSRLRLLARTRARSPLDQREPHLIAERVVRPDLGDRESAGRRTDAWRCRCSMPGRTGGKGARNARTSPTATSPRGCSPTRRSRPRRCPAACARVRSTAARGPGTRATALSRHRHRLLVAGIDGDVELSLVFRLEQANDPIVLELLANGPHEDGAQQNLRKRVQTGLNIARDHAALP